MMSLEVPCLIMSFQHLFFVLFLFFCLLFARLVMGQVWTVCVWRSEDNLKEVVLISGVWTQVIGFGREYWNLLGHFVNPLLILEPMILYFQYDLINHSLSPQDFYILYYYFCHFSIKNLHFTSLEACGKLVFKNFNNNTFGFISIRLTQNHMKILLKPQALCTIRDFCTW